MRKTLSVLSVAAILLTGCAVPETSSESVMPEVTDVAEFKGRKLELRDASYENGEIRVRAMFTNDTEDYLAAVSSFWICAYQDNAEINILDKYSYNEYAENAIREIKGGKSLECEFVFELSGENDVEVCVYTPTASQELLARKVYPYGSAESSTN